MSKVEKYTLKSAFIRLINADLAYVPNQISAKKQRIKRFSKGAFILVLVSLLVYGAFSLEKLLEGKKYKECRDLAYSKVYEELNPVSSSSGRVAGDYYSGLSSYNKPDNSQVYNKMKEMKCN
ncbi:hypothetical protein [Terasakiella sp.]|uniref:hypothetical protein n=1 Tax=Terasakiella sp. TaxID=2034861 RepID=UPI003AA91FDD